MGSFKDLFHRHYKTITAVDGISFEVPQGEILGYIGPNGAGKSTSIKMLTGILRPSGGEMNVYNYHPFRDRKEYTKIIGVVFGQRTQLWWDIAVQESFTLLARIYDVPQSEYKKRLKLLDSILDLEPLLRIPVRKLSLGQRMRCDLAASLLHRPKVLFLDEPTIGLDTVAKDSIRTFLRQVNKELGTTVILTTHDLREIEELCQRIIVLDKGRIVYDGELNAVRHLSGLTRTIAVDFVSDAPFAELNAAYEGAIHFHQEGKRRLVAEFDPYRNPAAELIRSIIARHEVADLSITEPSIEQVIMKIYREGLGDEGGNHRSFEARHDNG